MNFELSWTPCPHNAYHFDELVHQAFRDPERVLLAPLASFLGETLSSLHTSPMWLNVLERLGLSERHARRHITRLLAIMGLPSDYRSLRSYLHRVRITHAVGFLRVKGVTVSQVARSIGYGSEQALATAFLQPHFGSPTALRARLFPSPLQMHCRAPLAAPLHARGHRLASSAVVRRRLEECSCF